MMTQSEQMPDTFDRRLGELRDLPDVVSSRISVKQVVPPFGVGGGYDVHGPDDSSEGTRRHDISAGASPRTEISGL